ncbi:MAG: hypothetical protein JWM21_3548 [Acidobacteria bacterium]|nr:hypothetical protein [Acidobacteriota bacterium]
MPLSSFSSAFFGKLLFRGVAQSPDLHRWRSSQNVPAIEFRHFLVVTEVLRLTNAGGFLIRDLVDLLAADTSRLELFRASISGSPQLVEVSLGSRLYRLPIQTQRMCRRSQRHLPAARENFVTTAWGCSFV